MSFTLPFDEIPVTFRLTGRDNTMPMFICSLVLIVLSVRLLHDSEKD